MLHIGTKIFSPDSNLLIKVETLNFCQIRQMILTGKVFLDCNYKLFLTLAFEYYS